MIFTPDLLKGNFSFHICLFHSLIPSNLALNISFLLLLCFQSLWFEVWLQPGSCVHPGRLQQRLRVPAYTILNTWAESTSVLSFLIVCSTSDSWNAAGFEWKVTEGANLIRRKLLFKQRTENQWEAFPLLAPALAFVSSSFSCNSSESMAFSKVILSIGSNVPKRTKAEFYGVSSLGTRVCTRRRFQRSAPLGSRVTSCVKAHGSGVKSTCCVLKLPLHPALWHV